MLPFLQKIFGKKSGKQAVGCCGGGCCGGGNQKIDLGVSDNDRSTIKTLDEKIIIGKILEIRVHQDPKVTKVKVTQCDLGNGKTEQILCGGSNIAVGQIVPIAQTQTDLGAGFIIGERDIRGEVSKGMICARAELGISLNGEQKGEIWELPANLEKLIGMPLRETLI